MKSTVLADLFYRLGINPFYVVSFLVFFIPVACFLFFTVVTRFSLIFAIIGTIGVFVVCSVIFYVYFHRNPRRTIHNDMHAVLSPADGKVV